MVEPAGRKRLRNTLAYDMPVPMPLTDRGQLTLIEEAGGFRHYLDGVPIHAGTVLECYDPEQRRWLPVRFETVFGQRGRNAIVCRADGTSMPVSDNLSLRWPATS